VWQNVGLPSDGIVEVWAGMQGGSFKGLHVNITVSHTLEEYRVYCFHSAHASGQAGSSLVS
jgi:hypothetical protein